MTDRTSLLFPTTFRVELEYGDAPPLGEREVMLQWGDRLPLGQFVVLGCGGPSKGKLFREIMVKAAPQLQWREHD